MMFTSVEERAGSLAWLKSHWVRADIHEAPIRTAPQVERIFSLIESNEPEPLSVYLQGTNFQIKVWEALLHIPQGLVVSYEDIARYIGKPSSARAVSNAVACNPLPVMIPCHRVIRKSGIIGGYRYGTARKKALLGWEMSGIYA
jgi:AraC family transcriptional regulator of adaptative response/methylated-DNA-[protein]-cysteine methyltransferase